MYEIKAQIDKILVYLNRYYPLITCHMVEFFNKNLYEECIPENLKLDIHSSNFEIAIDSIFNPNIKNMPNLYEFIENCKQFLLYKNTNEEICINIKDFHEKLNKINGDNLESLKLDVFMKHKKSHEVAVLSSIAARLKVIGGTTHIVDIGDGKGYLSSLLALHYKIPVLGIDSSRVNTTGAIKRAEKLSRNWRGIIKNQNRTLLSPNERKFNSDTFLYKQITKFVTEDTNLKELVKNVFTDNPESISLVGLHTCGHLAVSSLQIFTRSNDIRTLCNVSCCYHFLEEKFELNQHLNAPIGFPVSDYLTRLNCELGRPCRMLSAQSVDRILSKKQLPSKTIFYRAILEVILDRYYPDLRVRHVGRAKKEPSSFTEYVKESLRRLNLDQSVISDKEIQRFYSVYADREKEVYFFNLLRAFMAPAIESLILLDRLLYLKERGVKNSFLVHLFDPVVSPRCYGIIAFKD